MKYFKNTELAKMYHVSEKSVRNWIQSARDGKLDLQLHEEKNRYYVSNTNKNTALIEQLVQKGKKYKNTRGLKTVYPKKEFYEHYNYKQTLDIISNLSVHHETPFQYTYVDGGVEDWDHYAKRLNGESIPNILTETVDLLEDFADGLQGEEKVNVIDLGPGNGLPIKPTLDYLIKQKRLNRYVAIDISQEMLDLLEKNLRSWFGKSIAFESYVRDFSYERFNDILNNCFNNTSRNVVFFLGGTLSNFRTPSQVLQTINDSLGLEDTLLYTGYLDTPASRRRFDNRFDRKIPVQTGMILDFLNIDESLYDAEQIFDEQKMARLMTIVPVVDISIEFEFPEGQRRIELRKGEPILVWRHLHYKLTDYVTLFDENDFDLLKTVKSQTQNYVLIVSKIKGGDSMSYMQA